MVRFALAGQHLPGSPSVLGVRLTNGESPHQWRAWGSVNQDRAGVTGLPALKSYAIRIYRVTAGFVVSMTFDRSITVTGFGQGLQFADQVVDGHLGISGRAIPSKVNAEFRGS